jgi:hypothetical protein
MKYASIKKEAQDKTNALVAECGIFFAFSNEQFEKGRPKELTNKELINIGMGGFMPKANKEKYLNGLVEISKWEKEAIKDVKAEEIILYELNNFEAFHSCDLTDTLSVLAPLGYTEDQVRKVYRKYAAYANI